MKIIECGGVWTGEGTKPLGPTRIYLAEGMIEELEPAPEIRSDLFVIPAFVDAHCHFIWTGLRSVLLDLGDVTSSDEFLSRVSQQAGSGGDEDILRGFGFDESNWVDGSIPSLEKLDAVTGDRPVILRRICGHRALVNSAMMRKMEEDSPGLDRSTGLITEGMIFELEKFYPPSRKLFEKALSNAVGMAHSKGVTAVYTFENYLTSEILQAGSPDLRISICLHGSEVLDDPRGSALKRATGLKFFLDGSIGAGSAAISGSYTNGAEFQPILTDDDVMESLELAESLKLVPIFHAIGGRALEQLDRVSGEFLNTRNGRFETGIRIEHAEDIGSVWPGGWNPDVHVFVMQPNFVSRWQGEDGLYARKLGKDYALGLNPFRKIMDAGFRVVFGSDGMPFGPLEGLPGATHHPDPDERLSVDRALRAYTLDAASVCGFRSITGSLRPDRTADLAVLSCDPFRNDWSEIEIMGTIQGGRPVYEKTRILEEL